jgi:DNA/RNA endonuclease G (NUC1)
MSKVPALLRITESPLDANNLSLNLPRLPREPLLRSSWTRPPLRPANICNYQVTVDEIEQRSGSKVLTMLSDADQAALKPVRGQLVRDIFC